MLCLGIYKHTMIATEAIDSCSKKSKPWKCDIEFAVSAIPTLGAVVSAAASVISSLLVMSGDIEENPGPRGS